MIHLCQKFTVDDLLYIVMKFYGLQKKTAGGKFKPLLTSEAGGYVATLHEKLGRTIKLKSGSIHIKTDKRKETVGEFSW